MTIDNVVFPARLAFGASGASQLPVDVVRLASGIEHRNRRWAFARRRYVISVGRRPMDELRELLAFFEARNGRQNGFLFRPPDNNSTAQSGEAPRASNVAIGTGDGARTMFQLIEPGGRSVRFPEPDTVQIAVDGVGTSAFDVDTATGTVTLQQAPAQGAAVTAGCRFFVPVRFDPDTLEISGIASGAGEAADIELVEVVQ